MTKTAKGKLMIAHDDIKHPYGAPCSECEEAEREYKEEIAPPETGRGWVERFNEMERNCEGAYGTGKFPPEVRKLFNQEIASALSQGYKIGAEKERERIRKAMMVYKCRFVADKNSYVSVKDIFKVLNSFTERKEQP